MPRKIPSRRPSLGIKAVNGKGWQSSRKKRALKVEDTSDELLNSTRRARQPTMETIEGTPVNQQDTTPSRFGSEKTVLDLHNLSRELNSSSNTFMEESIESKVYRNRLDFTMNLPVSPRKMSLIHRGWRNKSLSVNLHSTEMQSPE
jgi:hypothetical protein